MISSAYSPKASDYLNALQLSSGGKVLKLPLSVWRLGLSRIVYKLGPRPYCLFRLWSKDISTWNEYIDDSPLKPLLRSLSTPQDQKPIVDKILFFKECMDQNLSTVSIVGTFRQPSIKRHPSDLPEIMNVQQLESILRENPAGLFCKPHDGTHGIGAFAITPDTHGWRTPGGTSNTQEVLDFCIESAADGLVLVQPRLRNAMQLRPLMAEGGFGTVRAVT